MLIMFLNMNRIFTLSLGVFLIFSVSLSKTENEVGLQSSTSTVYFDTPFQNVGEMEGFVEVLIRRQDDEDESCSFVLYTEQGSATSPRDFTQTTQELLFLEEEIEKLAWVSIIDDNEIEPVEIFTIRLRTSDTDPDVIIAPLEKVVVQIWDDDIYMISPSSNPPQCGEGMCKNGGTCYGYADDEFVCDCTEYWTGATCEDASPCFFEGYPMCANGAQCYVSSPVDFWCDCDTWYRGEYCEIAPLLEPLMVYIISGCLFLFIVLLCILCCCCCCFCRKSTHDNRRHSSCERDIEMHNRKSWKEHESKSGLHKTNSYIPVPLPGTEARLGGKFEFPRDRLLLHEEIGHGAFATVYRAEAVGIVKKTTSTKVAVKMMKVGASETDRSDFIKELNLYKSLEKHPNIITLLGCCTEGVPMYLILEFAANGSLHSHLSRIRSGSDDYLVPKEKSLYPDDILAFASQIANGMEYLASKNCIHRDLATRNVLLSEDMMCKLSDFGLARDMENEQQYEMRSKGRVPVRWMAVESILQNIYTSQSDVWSFGVVLWELVTLGSHPYPGFNSREVIVQVQKGYRLPKPMHCSDDVYKMMQSCWKTDPSSRPTFKSLRSDLENMLGDAKGYLMMTDFNVEAYVYLEPNQSSQSQDNAQTNGGLDNHGFASEVHDPPIHQNGVDGNHLVKKSSTQSIKDDGDKTERLEDEATAGSNNLEDVSNTNSKWNTDVPPGRSQSEKDPQIHREDDIEAQRAPKKPPPLPRQPSAWF